MGIRGIDAGCPMTLRTPRSFVAVLAIITVARFGVALAGASAQVRDRDVSWVAPVKATRRVNPLVNRPDAAAGGEKLYQQRCATCHGRDGRGTTKAPNIT